MCEPLAVLSIVLILDTLACMASRTRIAIVAASVGGLALVGCTAVSEPTPDGLQVVATTTQMGDMTREVVGDAGTVTQLLTAGQSAHAFEPTPAALLALEHADVLVVNGAGLEEWLEPTIVASGFDGVVVDASSELELGAAEAHDHDDDEHDEHDEADHAGHDHGAVNPHLWTDPANAVQMAETIGAGIAAMVDDPSTIHERTDAYVERLVALDAWVHASIDQVSIDDRLLVTNHDTYAALAEATDITVVGTIMPALDANAQPSAADIDALVAAIEETGVAAVFSESTIDPALAAMIADEADVQVLAGDDGLTADALGPAGSATSTYIDAEIHDVTQIVESWGATPVPVPEALR